eukprot:scaffold67572_cov35-Attheya_sp.AAC.1
MDVGPAEHKNQEYGWKEGRKGFSQLVWMAQSDRYSYSYNKNGKGSHCISLSLVLLFRSLSVSNGCRDGGTQEPRVRLKKGSQGLFSTGLDGSI